MKIVVFCNDFLAFPSIELLGEKKFLAGLVVPTSNTEIDLGVRLIAERFQTPIYPLTGSISSSSLGDWLRSLAFDVAFVITFPNRIPEDILTLSPRGFYNWHPGLLPAYRGPDPIFWQILNQEPNGGITIHKMTASLDSGPIVFVEEVRILPEDTYGSHLRKLTPAATRLAKKMLLALGENPNAPEAVRQDESKSGYQKMPGPQDLIINWNSMSAARTRALIHACNPFYGGAAAILRDSPLRIMKASLGFDRALTDSKPGAIIITTDGAEVICRDRQSIRLEIVEWNGSLVGGLELMQMLRVKPGESFQS